MPIAMHADLANYYFRSHHAAYESGLNPVKFIYLVNRHQGGNFLAHFFHASFVEVLKPFLPGREVFQIKDGGGGVGWEEFVDHPMIHWILVVWKIPYLVFDYLGLLLLLHIVADTKKGLLAAKFWMLNPISLYATYVFGRFDSITLFLVLLSLFYAKRKQYILSSLAFGVALALREYLIIMLPIYVVTLIGGRKKQAALLVLGVLPLILISGTQLFIHFTSQPETGSPASFQVRGMTRIDYNLYPLSMKIPLQPYENMKRPQNIYLFVLGYTLLMLYVDGKDGRTFKTLWTSLLAAHLLFYATCQFNPQWFIWITPFIVFAIVEDSRFIKLFGLQAMCWALTLLYWDPDLTTWLFQPIWSGSFYSMPGLMEPINSLGFRDPLRIIDGFRTIFSACGLWMIYLLYGKRE